MIIHKSLHIENEIERHHKHINYTRNHNHLLGVEVTFINESVNNDERLFIDKIVYKSYFDPYGLISNNPAMVPPLVLLSDNSTISASKLRYVLEDETTLDYATYVNKFWRIPNLTVMF